MQHHSGILHLAAVGYPQTFSGYACSTTLGLGKMLALVVGKQLPDLEIGMGKAGDILRRIWPARDAFAWPLPHTITDSEAGALANILREALNNFRTPR